MNTHDKPITGHDKRRSVSSVRRLTFRLLLIACLGAYGLYSYAGIRVAMRGWRYLNENKPATARTAFRYVLDRQSFSIAVPFARATLLYKIPELPGSGPDRLAIWSFERMIDDAVYRVVASTSKALERPSLLDDVNGKCTPVTCDLAPLAALAVSIPLAILFSCSFFLWKESSFGSRLAGLLFALAILACVLADPYVALRATLIQEGIPFEVLMAYDYAKYVLGGLILLLTLRQWVFARWRWSGKINALGVQLQKCK